MSTTLNVLVDMFRNLPREEDGRVNQQALEVFTSMLCSWAIATPKHRYSHRLHDWVEDYILDSEDGREHLCILCSEQARFPASLWYGDIVGEEE